MKKWPIFHRTTVTIICLLICLCFIGSAFYSVSTQEKPNESKNGEQNTSVQNLDNNQDDDDAEVDEFKPLYESNDHVLIIQDWPQFNDTIFGKNTSFFVQFYASWCGHCQQFAPFFKQFAKKVIGWQSITKLVVVDCSANINEKLCRDNAITAYPTIKYFPYSTSSIDNGLVYQRKKETDDFLINALPFFVQDDWSKQKPKHWPRFEYFDSNSSVKQLWQDVSSNVNYLALIFEPSMSDNKNEFPGARAILDHMNNTNLHIKLFEFDSKSLLAKQFRFIDEKTSIPGLVVLQRRSLLKPYFLSKQRLSYDEINAVLELHSQDAASINANIETTTVNKILGSMTSNLSSTGLELFVHKLDLLSSVRYIFYREITKYKVIASIRLHMFREFVEILLQYFPSNDNERSFFFDVVTWLNGAGSKISADDWSQKLASFQKQYDFPLLKADNWVACRGSAPRYRGFPCSLWMLLHTLTVNYYLDTRSSRPFTGYQMISVFRGFIKEVFGCRECAENFQNETIGATQELNDKKPADLVIFLWKVHNSVNKRLKGVRSEDPLYPKEQFPTVAQCSDCIDQTSGQFNQDRVLNFLINFYTNIRTVEPESNDASSIDKTQTNNSRFRNQRTIQGSVSNASPAVGGFSSSSSLMVIGVCIGLWFSSMALLRSID